MLKTLLALLLETEVVEDCRRYEGQGYQNGASSSPFTKSASDVDGKGQNYKRLGIGLSNQKKAVMKAYTSPTISASSKAIRQSKGVLSERSEKSESVNNKTQMETGSGQDPNSCSGAHSRPQSGSLSHEDSGLNDGLSTEQYDPLTNYLSPRPKFLRYKPNRSREIFLRQQNEVGEDIYGGAALNNEQKVLFSPGSSSSDSENKQEEEEGSEEEGEEIEEDDEEFEVDKGWTFKKVFKFLALLMAAVLYATHISSSNTDSMSSHSFQSNEDLRSGTCSAEDWKSEAEFETKLLWENDFLDPMYGRRRGWREEEVKMFVHKFENGSLNVNNILQKEEVDGGFHDQSAEVAKLKDAEREFGGFEGARNDGEDDLAEVEEQEFQDLFENVMETNEDQNQFSSEIAAAEEMAITKTDISEKDGEQEFEDHFHCKEPTETKIFKIIETPFSSEIACSDSNFFSSLQNMNTQQFFKILARFSAFLTTVIVSVVFYRSKKKIAVEKQQFQRVEALGLENETALAKISPLILKACSESVIVEENNSIISQEGRTLASIWLKEEEDISIERYYSSRAPTVELLGEFVIGGETENTLKNKMVESKDSNNLVSIEERSAYSRPALSELSNSPSHGSFTAEKIMKKKAGRGADLKVISTPVRRSSRIKNRAAMSP